MQVGARPPYNRLAPLGPDRDGFIPSDWVLSAKLMGEYEQRMAALRTGPSRTRVMDRVPQENLEAMLARVRARGALPILFVAPYVGGYVNLPRREVAPLFDFSDPQKWPELFEPQYHADIGHLNTAGAEVFTRKLSEAFLATLPAEHR